MPNQLRSVADRAEQEDQVTVRVIPFDSGEYPGGLFGTFTLMEFGEGLPDALFLDSDRGAFTMVTAGDPQVASYKDNFETILQSALSAEKSVELIRHLADEMST